MKVRDLIAQSIDIDVYDDVCDALAIAFCGPLELKAEGLEKFGDVLDYEVKIKGRGTFNLPDAIVKVDDPDENTWKQRLKKAKAFFESAAGYCAESDYKKWFREVEA